MKEMYRMRCGFIIFMAIRGKQDPFFLPAGAEAFSKDVPNAVVELIDTGHWNPTLTKWRRGFLPS